LITKQGVLIERARREYKKVFIDKIGVNYQYRQINGEELAYQYNPSSRILNLLFDGSNSCKEWASNLKVLKKQSNDISDNSKAMFHKGFYDTFEFMWEGFLKDLIESKNIKRIYIRGHSRGAVAALLTHRKIKKYYKRIIPYGIGFGMPCCMNLSAALECNIYEYTHDFISVEHYQDIVPHVLKHKMGYEPAPCKYVYTGSKWARRFRFWKRIYPHTHYFDK